MREATFDDIAKAVLERVTREDVASMWLGVLERYSGPSSPFNGELSDELVIAAKHLGDATKGRELLMAFFLNMLRAACSSIFLISPALTSEDIQ